MRKYYLSVVIALLALIGCDEVLYHGLSEQQANEILVALAERGIDAQKRQDGSLWNVITEKNQLGDALLILRRRRLPRFEMASDNESSSFLPGREEREYRRERQISRNLESTLMALPEMVEARVHLALSTRVPQGIDPTSRAASASVLLVHRAGAKVDLSAIKSIVSGASGVPPSQIAVVDRNSDEGEEIRAFDGAPPLADDLISDSEGLPHELTFFFPSRRNSKLALMSLAVTCFAASAFGVFAIARKIKINRLRQAPDINVSPPPPDKIEPSSSDSIFNEVFIENGRIVRRQEFLQ